MHQTRHFFGRALLLAMSAGTASGWTTGDVALILAELPAGAVHQHQMIPMRDGIRLSTHIFLPDGFATSAYPVVLVRSAYNDWKQRATYANDVVSQTDPSNYTWINTTGYVYVFQDLRGDGESEVNDGFEPRLSDNEIEDTYDTVESLATNAWCNGRVGMYGGSGHGIAAYMGWLSKAPHLVVAAPANTAPNLHQHWSFENGVRRWSYRWLQYRNRDNRQMPEWPKPTLGDYYDRERWMETLRQGAKDNRTILLAGDSWHNYFGDATFEMLNAMGPSNRAFLTMDPGTHQGNTASNGLVFPRKPAPYLAIPSMFQILDGAPFTNPPTLKYFVMGDARRPVSSGNFYRFASQWPPPSERGIWYLHPNGRMDTREPASSTGALAYTYHPTHPVPTVGGHFSFGFGRPSGPQNQLVPGLMNRSDILRFETAPFPKEVEIAGSIIATLYVSTDVEDTLFTVKLVDIYPAEGTNEEYHAILRESAILGRYAGGLANPAPMVSGRVYRLEIALPALALMVETHHRLGLHITSSSEPAFEVHPNTYEPVLSYDRSPTAHCTLHMSREYPSRVAIPIATPPASTPASGQMSPAQPHARSPMKSSALTLMPLLSDHMVLQRNTTSTFAGRDAPGQRVDVEFRGQRATTTAAADGSWHVNLPTGAAGGPFELTIAGSDVVILRDVLVGEVWLASGQSNMQWRMDQCSGARADYATLEPLPIRYFTVAQKATPDPMDTVHGEWRVLDASSAPSMSAVGFYFARRVWTDLRVPIGIVVSAWGGTPAEAWTPGPAFSRNDTTRRILAGFEATRGSVEQMKEEAARALAAWEREYLPPDPGNTKLAAGWALPRFDDSAWNTMNLPAFWQGRPEMNFNGVVWFRKTIDVPEAWRGRDLELNLGPIDDFDDTYVNGVRVGGIGPGVFQSHALPRSYTIPAALTREPQLTVAVRAFDHFGAGGFGGTQDQMRVSLPGAADSVPLHGLWAYAVEHRLPPTPTEAFRTYPSMPMGLLPEHRPAHVFNAMVHPLHRTSFAGVIWYQGESNGGRSAQYADLFRALIEGWREHFRLPELPFLFVQLPNFAAGADWPLLREAQEAALSLPATGMAVTLDVGDTSDIHPQRKAPVGERLALLALRTCYDRDVACHSPRPTHIAADATRIRIRFGDTGGGLLTTDQKPPRGFELSGPDGRFLAAEAHIDGDSVVVSHTQVSTPRGVRYAFAAEPEANLVGRTGLPVAPFRKPTI